MNKWEIVDVFLRIEGECIDEIDAKIEESIDEDVSGKLGAPAQEVWRGILQEMLDVVGPDREH